MEQIFAFLFLTALILAIIFVWRYLKVIPNYKKEYLLESHYPLELKDLEKIPNLYQIQQLSSTKYKLHYNHSLEELTLVLTKYLPLRKSDFTVLQLHSWLKTNLWKNTP